jgi:hypothetical protein
MTQDRRRIAVEDTDVVDLNWCTVCAELLGCCYAALCCNSEEMIDRFKNHSLHLNTVFKPLKHGYTCRREFKKHCRFPDKGKELRTQI